MPQASSLRRLDRGTRITLVAAVLTTATGGALSLGGANPLITFIATGLALASLASLVSDATDELGARAGPAITGILQSALGNLPELFIAIFALRAGLVEVVQAALVGSILANSLLVLGLAFFFGGLRHGAQKFAGESPKLIGIMTLLAVGALALPTAASGLHTPAASHGQELSVAVAILLLVVFAATVVFSLRSSGLTVAREPDSEEEGWPMWLILGLLGLAGAGAAFVSDWFVNALVPATATLGISAGFTGLVIVAIAGNAVENAVGVRLAIQNRCDLAVSCILNSSLQVALALIPALVLFSLLIPGGHLTLILAPMLVLALGLTAVVSLFIVFDEESTWIEGVALIGLYTIIAASFLWG